MKVTIHVSSFPGCGVNVSNSQPTICVNDIIQLHNAERGSNLTTLSTSQVLATAVSAMETTLTQFQKKGHLDFCQQYYKYWLHRYTHLTFYTFFWLMGKGKIISSRKKYTALLPSNALLLVHLYRAQCVSV